MPLRPSIRSVPVALPGAALSCGHAAAADAVTEVAWARGDGGIVVVQANWGRQWPCAGYENAQLVSLEFRRDADHAGGTDVRLALEPPACCGWTTGSSPPRICSRPAPTH